MNDARWREISDLFGRVFDLPEPDRRVELDRLSADESIKTEVLELLAAESRAGARFEPPPEYRRMLGADEPSPGARFGAWRLEAEIARGGMGSVWLARRDDGQFAKRVALKLVRAGAADAHLASRFLNERQILADLEHPGIVSILDGGADPDGRPYLVMEFIEGVSIDRFVAESDPSLEERVALVADLCDIVQFVHDQGILHRDLKPSNVLVTTDRRVRLIDFGIAKSILTATPDELTATHMRPLTPRYASPEQLLRGTADVRGDVYSLGVLLYELLTGESPYGSGIEAAELERRVCEIDPPAPSATVRRKARHGQVATASPGRDLDTITSKALEKDPARRYSSASELGGELRRVLAHEPIRARPPSVWYRVRRFTQRRRGLSFALLVTFAASVAIAFVIERARRDGRSQQAALRHAQYRVAIRAAARAIDAAQCAAALRALEEAPTEYRGFEWRHLQALADSSRGTLYRFQDHDSLYPTFVRPLDPAGDRFAFACAINGAPQFAVIDGANGSVLHSRPESKLPTIQMSASRDGAILATIESSSFIQPGFAWMRGIDDPALDRRLVEDATSVSLVPGSRRALVGTSRGEVLAFDEEGALRVRAAPHASSILALVASPDGALIASGSFDESIALLDAETLESRARLLGHEMGVSALVFRPDGERLLSVATDRSFRIWSVADGRELLRELDLPNLPMGAAWPESDGPVYLGSTDGAIREYDAETGALSRTWLGCRATPSTIEFVRDRDGVRRMIVGEQDRSIRVFDIDRLPVREIKNLEYSPVVRFDPSGDRILSPGPDGAIRIYDRDDGRRIAALRLDPPIEPNVGEQAVNDAIFDPTGRFIFSGHQTRDVAAFDTTSLECIAVARSLGAPIRSLAHHPTLPIVVAIDNIGGLYGFETPSLKPIFTSDEVALSEEASEQSMRVFFAPKGERFFVVRYADLSWHDPRTGATLGRVPKFEWGYSDPQFTRHSRTIIGHVYGEGVKFLDLESGRIVRSIPTGESTAALAVHPTEPRLAIGTATGSIRIFDLESGDELLVLPGRGGPIADLNFSPDGTTLVSASMGGSIRLFHTVSDR